LGVIERIDLWRHSYRAWLERHPPSPGDISDYPFVENQRAPFMPVSRALPMLDLALVSSAGAFIDGSDAFDLNSPGGDMTFREIPTEIELAHLRFSARGYDPAFVGQDPNVEVPLARLFEFEKNRVIGKVCPAFWSFCGFVPDAGRLVEELLPRLVERVKRYDAQAALLIPASKLCHQSVALAARALEQAGIPTMTLAVARDVMERVRAPRAAYYKGDPGSVAGRPNWPEHQRRILDEALRWLEPMDEPSIYNLTVELESQVERARGER
jgi:D-proline reductase (dithiol) PrdB